MKKITNTAKIVVNSQSDEDIGKKVTYNAIIAHSDEVNSNGYNLIGNALVFNRDKYPLLYNHNDQDLNGLLGWNKPYYDEDNKDYRCEFGFYKGAEKLQQAVDDGTLSEVSVSYYVDEGEFDDNYILNIKKATFAELSIVSVGADPKTSITKNGFNEELEKEKRDLIENARKLKELKEKYECI